MASANKYWLQTSPLWFAEFKAHHTNVVRRDIHFAEDCLQVYGHLNTTLSTGWQYYSPRMALQCSSPEWSHPKARFTPWCYMNMHPVCTHNEFKGILNGGQTSQKTTCIQWQAFCGFLFGILLQNENKTSNFSVYSPTRVKVHTLTECLPGWNRWKKEGESGDKIYLYIIFKDR